MEVEVNANYYLQSVAVGASRHLKHHGTGATTFEHKATEATSPSRARSFYFLSLCRVPHCACVSLCRLVCAEPGSSPALVNEKRRTSRLLLRSLSSLLSHRRKEKKKNKAGFQRVMSTRCSLDVVVLNVLREEIRDLARHVQHKAAVVGLEFLPVAGVPFRAEIEIVENLRRRLHLAYE